MVWRMWWVASLYMHVLWTLLIGKIVSSPVCYQYKEYIGHDITSYKGIKNPHECQEKCQTNIECKFWSWIDTEEPGAEQCWIKEYIISEKGHGSQGQTVISGPKLCGNYIFVH